MIKPIAASLLGLFALYATPLAAQSSDDFYRGKRIFLIIGNAPGAEYDLGGRLLARYLGRHIPGNPTIVVQNMQGAAGIVAANYMYAVAPKDGTVFASVSRNLPAQAVIGRETLKADPRQFGWIGGSGLPSRVCYARSDSPVMTAQDLFSKQLIVAGAGAGSSLSIVPTVLKRVLDMNFRVIEGYKGTASAVLAMENHEVDGVCHTFGPLKTTHAALLQNHEIRLLLRAEESPLADAPGLPSIYDYVKDDQQKQVLRFIFSSVELGRPYFFPPGTPPERLAILRTAFAASLADPELVAEAAKLQTDMVYRSPEQMEALIRDLYATPRALVDLAEEIVPNPGE